VVRNVAVIADAGGLLGILVSCDGAGGVEREAFCYDPDKETCVVAKSTGTLGVS
jgi:hypothetical protein